MARARPLGKFLGMTFAAGLGADGLTPTEQQIAGRVAVVLPADEAWNGVAALHAGVSKDPMMRLGAYPVAASIDGRYVTSSHQIALVRAAMWVRAMFLLAFFCPAIIAAVRAAPREDT